jgi:hypothetical protein
MEKSTAHPKISQTSTANSFSSSDHPLNVESYIKTMLILHQEPTSPYKHNLVGGIPTPLKNDGVRQLGS